MAREYAHDYWIEQARIVGVISIVAVQNVREAPDNQDLGERERRDLYDRLVAGLLRNSFAILSAAEKAGAKKAQLREIERAYRASMRDHIADIRHGGRA